MQTNSIHFHNGTYLFFLSYGANGIFPFLFFHKEPGKSKYFFFLITVCNGANATMALKQFFFWKMNIYTYKWTNFFSYKNNFTWGTEKYMLILQLQLLTTSEGGEIYAHFTTFTTFFQLIHTFNGPVNKKLELWIP